MRVALWQKIWICALILLCSEPFGVALNYLELRPNFAFVKLLELRSELYFGYLTIRSCAKVALWTIFLSCAIWQQIRICTIKLRSGKFLDLRFKLRFG